MSKNYAVLVGINRYSGYIRHNGKIVPLNHHRLYGCVNDIEIMQALLIQKYDFSAKNTRMLSDEDATKEAIVESLGQMTRSAAAGDRLLFYFSGHGSMYAAPSANGVQGHPFEILCPYDMDWDRECFISGRMIKSMVNNLPDRTALEIVLDACCAGGMKDVTRLHDASVSVSRAAESTTVPSTGARRFLRPPDEVLERIAGRHDTATVERMTSSVGSLGPKRCILWAASNDHQTSDEYVPSHGREHGAFTYFFAKQLDASPAATRAAVLKGVRASLNDERFSQTPQLFPESAPVTDDGFLEAGVF